MNYRSLLAASALSFAVAGCATAMDDDMDMEMDDAVVVAPTPTPSPMATTRSTTTTTTTTTTATGPEPQMLEGAAMYANRNIVQNAMNSPVHTTLVAAVKAAGLVDTLQGPGPFTVFAPTDAAFARLPAGALDDLLLPSNKAALADVLTYHVVPGKISSQDLMARIRAGNGVATLTTVEGSPLTFRMNQSFVEVRGENGNNAYISTADLNQSNGYIHVINGVLGRQ